MNCFFWFRFRYVNCQIMFPAVVRIASALHLRNEYFITEIDVKGASGLHSEKGAVSAVPFFSTTGYKV